MVEEFGRHAASTAPTTSMTDPTLTRTAQTAWSNRRSHQPVGAVAADSITVGAADFFSLPPIATNMSLAHTDDRINRPRFRTGPAREALAFFDDLMTPSRSNQIVVVVDCGRRPAVCGSCTRTLTKEFLGIALLKDQSGAMEFARTALGALSEG
jgi:hypothetical protein